MLRKLIGAIMIVTACGGFGFSMAHRHRREIQVLQQFLASLDYLESELQYRLTPLPQLCRKTAALCPGPIGTLYRYFAQELEGQVSPDAQTCFSHAMALCKLPRAAEEAAKNLGSSLGMFDLSGQLRGIGAVRSQGNQVLKSLQGNCQARIRNYQTLGICTGAALAIVLI